MSLIKFNRNKFPWNEAFIDFFNRNEFFNDNFFNLEKSLPAINIKEHDTDYELEMAAPGFNKKDFEITLKDDLLEVSAEKEMKNVEEEENYTRKEFNYNSFRRVLQLPSTVDSNKKVKATYKDGILKMNLLKKEETKEKTKRVINIAWS